jgi:hypothetical protein
MKPTRVAGVILLTFFLGGCDFVSPVDSNPNSVAVASVDQLFTGIQVNSYFWTEGQIARITAIWTQQMAGTDKQFVNIDNYAITEEDANDEFSTVYTGGGLIDIRTAIAQAEDVGRGVYAGILKVHEAYMLGMTASIFGDIPYSEAVTDGISEPVLDGQAAVYMAIQSLLDDAIGDLGSGAGSGPGDVDLNFAGDAASWTAVAYTLKARFHMHWAEVTGASAYTAALAAAQNGIQDVSGNWKALHTSDPNENNLWFQFQRDRVGHMQAGDFMIPLMVADADPRLPIYFSDASGGGYAPRDSELSATGYGAPAFDVPILSCAENAFIIAEAQFAAANEPGAISAVQDGLTCQEDELGIDLSATAATIAGLTGAPLLAEIMNQKYIALFLNAEVYNDYKRTCLPAITERPGGMPGRLFYGQDERQSNSNIPEPAQQKIRNDNDPDPC